MQRRVGAYVTLKDEEKSMPEVDVLAVQNRGRFVQHAFGMVGAGAIAVYIPSGKVCALDEKCFNAELAKVPPEYRTAILVASGGVEFALSSALCAMDSIPAYLNLLDKYKGISKYIKGAAIVTAAAGASLEVLFITIKTYPSIEQALTSYTTWLAYASMIPFNLYGMVNIVSKDFPRMSAAISRMKKRCRGERMVEDASRVHMQMQYKKFQQAVANKWAQVVPQAKTIAFDKNEKPLYFLFRAELEEKEKKSSCLNSIAKGIFGTIATGASIGAVVPPVVNTYRFLQEQLADDDSSAILFIGLGMLSMLIGFPRMRAVFGKTIHGALSLADWSLSQDLEFQLNPKSTVVLWLLGIAAAYESYAVLKVATLANFQGKYQQPIAEAAATSIEISHLAFSIQFVTTLWMRYGSHFLYSVQKAVREALAMSFEDFCVFYQHLKPEAKLLFNLHDYYEPSTVVETEVVDVTSETKQSDAEEGWAGIPEAVPEAVLESAKENEESDAPKKQRLGHGWCNWFKKSEDVPAVENNAQDKQSKLLNK